MCVFRLDTNQQNLGDVGGKDDGFIKQHIT